MDTELRNKLIKRARENGSKFGKKAELDFGAGAEWMYDELLQNQTTPEERGEELVCDVCKGVGVRCIEDKTDDCWFCNGTGEAN